MNGRFYLPPLPRLGWFAVFDPRFHRGLLSAAPPALPKENQSGRGESESLTSEGSTIDRENLSPLPLFDSPDDCCNAF